jgi:mannose-1-phosphate guanylyltransferase/mannose-6-phosphate isomerase
MLDVIPVVLCGGSGTRLWPLSRAGFPKQFLVLSGTTSLFQQAISRINAIACEDIRLSDTLVVTNEEHRFLALDQLRELKAIKASLLLEPTARNTAPALTLAALQALELGEDPILVVTPSDQTIIDQASFTDVLRNAVRAAEDGSIIILGITPDKPETGYGYIKRQGVVGSFGEYSVAQFAEKPDLNTARQYLESGEYAWNSGMFVLRASTWLNALAQYRPDIDAGTRAAWCDKTVDAQFIRPIKALFELIPSESIDYAVIERCPESKFPIKMMDLSAGWNDLGAWDAVWQVGAQDQNGNVMQGDTFQADTTNSLIYASSRLVSAVGVDNLVIVETADAVLVTDRSQSQHVKKIVAMLEKSDRGEHTLHRKVHRPWGWYDSIDEDDRFKVKRINVKPGASLSLQKHHHRAEHWIVVKGTAEVTCGDKVILLTENQSTYIPLGEVHRLKNPGAIPLEIIEVQSGSYLGEDDIVRFEDTYGRTSAS